MNLGFPALGAAFAALLMTAVAMKWALPRRQALTGIAVTAVLTALPFIWIYPLVGSEGAALGVAALVFGQVVLAVAVALFVVLRRFWRDPERVPPETGRVVLSAADGEIAYIWHLAEDTATVVRKGEKDYRLDELTGTQLASGAIHVIGVSMSLMDVHVNRCPIPGRVRLIKHIPGKFLSLRKDEAPFVNERATTVIEGDSLNVGVVQIASRLVRCVQTYLKVDQGVDYGQRLGMIRFGSLVAIIIPDREDVRIEVTPGDYVWAGTSILARYGAEAANE